MKTLLPSADFLILSSRMDHLYKNELNLLFTNPQNMHSRHKAIFPTTTLSANQNLKRRTHSTNFIKGVNLSAILVIKEGQQCFSVFFPIFWNTVKYNQHITSTQMGVFILCMWISVTTRGLTLSHVMSLSYWWDRCNTMTSARIHDAYVHSLLHKTPC